MRVPATLADEMLDPQVRERIMKSLHHQEGDRVPVWDSLNNGAVLDHFAPGERDLRVAAAKACRALGIDMIYRVDDPRALPEQGTRTAQKGWETVVAGETTWVAERPFKTVEDLKKAEFPSFSEEQLREEGVPGFVRAMEIYAPETLLVPGGWCGFHWAYDYIGLALFSIAIYDAPWEIERIMGQFADNAHTKAKVFAEKRLAPLYFIPDDVAYKGALLFSPSFLRKTLIPILRRVTQPLKEAGIKVIFHSDGYVTPLVDDLIEAGIAGLHPIEPLAGNDIGLLKRRYGDRLVLVGNVDSSQLLPFGTREEIREGVKACLRAASPGGGHFIGSSTQILPSTPLENVITFYDAIREFGGYPVGV